MKLLLLLFLPIFLLLHLSAFSQTVTVRLYSLHAEHRLNITARTGSLTWRTCANCAATEAKALSLELKNGHIAVQEGASAERLLITGDYLISPKQGLKASLTAPLELKASPDSILVLATLPLEDYVAAALQGETATFNETESLKAMAVAVRTYAVRFSPRHKAEGFDLCDSTHCQALNFTAISSRVRSAVDATRGELLWFNASPAATYYHQNCGGTLAAGREVWPDLEAPYLKVHPDPFCLRATPLAWRAEFSRDQLNQALRGQGLTVPAHWTTLDIVRRSSSGRVLELSFRGATPPISISASSLRFALGRTFGWNRVRSDLYELEGSGGQIVFRGRGAGHGVGLCQAGAEQMAREGRTYRQILDFYYPGTSVGISARGLAWQERRSDHFLLLSTQPEQDAAILRDAEAALASLESDLGWSLRSVTKLRIFPTMDAYRNSTGEPGWIAAVTRDQTVSLQPLSVLRAKSAYESTLRHELAHLLLESRARSDTPLWFREGLTSWIAEPSRHEQPLNMSVREIEAGLEHPVSRESLEHSYAAARTRVEDLIEKNGRQTVLSWLANGLPASSRPPHH